MQLRDVMGKLVRPWTLFRGSTGRFVEVEERTSGWEDEIEYAGEQVVTLEQAADRVNPGDAVLDRGVRQHTAISIGRTS